MLHAISMGLAVSMLWLLLTQRWHGAEDLALAASVGAGLTLIAMRMGGATPALLRVPSATAASLSRVGASFAGAVATLRTAIAADVKLKPGLVRVKSTLAGRDAAAFAGMVTSAPGAAVIDTDEEGMFVHVLDEDAVDAVELGRLQHQAQSQRGRGR